MNERVHWVVCAVVKRWALQNDLKNQGMFTSYALAWMVLFYLMTIKVVPPLKFLRDNAQYSEDKSGSEIMFIEGTLNTIFNLSIEIIFCIFMIIDDLKNNMYLNKY